MPHGRAAPAPVSQHIQRAQCIIGHFAGCAGYGTSRQFTTADAIAPHLWPRHKIVNKVRCLLGGVGMSPHWSCRFVGGAAAAHFASQPALAQVIPSSELPGRAREQFEQPRVPLSQPGAAVMSLPSTVAPQGAEKLMVIVRGVRITGSTVYSAEDLEPLYRDIIGREVPVTAIYDIAQRITAKYGGDGYVLSRAIVPPQELTPARRGRAHPDHRRLYRPGRVAAGRCRSTATSFRTTRPRSPPSARSMSRRSSATCCWPATFPA